MHGWAGVSHAGQQFTMQAPELTQAEISSVPGASAEGQDKVKLEVLERGTAPGAFTIKQDEHKYWSMQTGDILQQYENLKEQTATLVQQVFGSAPSAEAEPSAGSAKDGEGDPVVSEVELESLAKLEESLGIEFKCSSEVANVELLLAKDKSVWLMASQDRTVPKHQTLGGYVGPGSGLAKPIQWMASLRPSRVTKTWSRLMRAASTLRHKASRP